MSPRRVITRWVDRFGVQPTDQRQVVAFVRISQHGWFRWEWEVWWTTPIYLASPGRRERVRHAVNRFSTRGTAATRWQCATASSRHVATRSHNPRSTS